MNKELEKKLADNFSFMKKGKTLSEQHEAGFVDDLYSAFGLECGDGWYDLIYELCTEITKLYKEYNMAMNLHIEQIKEKFGGLRFYYSTNLGEKDNNEEFRNKLRDLVENYCDKSYEVCEDCGKAGKLRRDLDWHRTLCDECYNKELSDSAND